MMTNTVTTPLRGFERNEFEARTEKLQKLMAKQHIGGVFFSTEPEFRYFSGFKSQFWESPTRPWFLVIPVQGLPIAVIPDIGVAGFEDTWIEDVRSWPSPRPEDDGIRLLANTLAEVSKQSKCIGAMLGPETHLRMPATNFRHLEQRLSQYNITDITTIVRHIRSIKSSTEIDKIRFACEVTAAGFDFLLENLQAGITEREACKAMQIEMLRLGADTCPYLIATSGPNGYDNIIMGPTDRQINQGDILIIDTGANFDGYFSDFDRNFAFGEVEQQAYDAYEAVFESTEAGLLTAAPGQTTGDVWKAMWSVLEKAGALGNDVGRMGHGLGMQLTEWPSNVKEGDVVLQQGMVLTLEPGMTYAPNKVMVHEENIVITESGCELLHKRAWSTLPVISR
ncbi:peptidase M24 [Candidatus Endobugula sertula]|uniref:Peptidase M24 n=1 Tax=Candidatus Endobugula sertula TaxID=62101 RepID=A0A1D2QU22_9GAMM|nr:peptidase M24 [Candidatus Endobugula sertula]